MERTYAFGPFQFDTGDRVLIKDGQSVPLTPKAADLLVALLASEGKVVSQEELFKRVWPDTFGEPGRLTFQVNQLRHALGETRADPKYIETVPRRGYRFVAPVRVIPTGVAKPPEVLPGAVNLPAVPADQQVLTAPPLQGEVDRLNEKPRSRLRWVGIGGGALFIAVAAFAAIGRSEPPVPSVARITKVTHDGRLKTSPMLTDGDRVLYSTSGRQRWASVDASGTDTATAFEGFVVLDFSIARAEALAIRPDDAGAEHGLWIINLRDGKNRRLQMVRTAGHAAWSNDGSRVAYSFQNSIWIANPDGIEAREIQSLSGKPRWFQWSPGDRSLRFTLDTMSDRKSHGGIWTINTDGSGLQPLLTDWPERHCCGRWMPNGVDYVFQAGPVDGLQVWLSRERSRLFRTPLRQRVQLTHGSIEFLDPLPSRDGRRVFAMGITEPQLVRYDPERRELLPYLGGIAAFAVDHSPDAMWVVYVKRSDFTLWRAQSDGSAPRQLTFAPFEVHSADWSPDGRTIALRGTEPGKRSKVYTMPSDGGTPVPLVPDDIEQGIPSWSHDSTKLTFGDVPETFGVPTGTETIHTVDLVRREHTRVPGSSGFWTSRWSTDGRYLAALTIRERELMLFEFATNQWKSLNVKHMNNPTWSRDSKYVYCNPEGPEFRFRRVRIADGNVEVLVDLKDFIVPWAGATPDGHPLILRRLTDIYALELEWK